MINYYQILDVKKTDDRDYIIKKYNKKILKYKNLPFLSSEQKEDVKNLKTALYILSNEELKILYDNYLKALKKQEKELDSDNLNDNLGDKYVSLKKKELKDKDNKYLSDRLFSITINQSDNFYENEARLRS
jgi:DnaJ-class molecular chaperone